MTIYDHIKILLKTKLAEVAAANGWVLPAQPPEFTVEAPRDPKHGDIATNLAMTLTKAIGKPPRAIADAMVAALKNDASYTNVEVAGPGFINLRLASSIWQEQLKTILNAGIHYGDLKIGNNEKVCIEYVSANPTGPMHAGHVRGAVFGDALSNLMQKVGYDVTREYYFNDAGTQVDVLARTVHLRYREALGETIGDIPQGLYPGDYLKPVAEKLVARDGKKWQGQPEEMWLQPIREFAVTEMMEAIREDLKMIGIKHDHFSNEREVIEDGTLDKVFKSLEAKDLIYVGTLPPPRGKEMEDWKPEPLTLFRSSQFGDSSDRSLKKRDGTWSYIMPDIAYHYTKIQRGFKLMINVLGADHGGYLERMRPAIAAISDGSAKLDVLFCQMVKVFNNGEAVKLSKRSGNIITLREMVEEVGADSVRFTILTRSFDSQFEFDFAKTKEQSRDNPVFYIQYAHARCCSVLRHAAEMFPNADLSVKALANTDLSILTSEDDIALIRFLCNWPKLVEAAAQTREPHRISFYLYDLAGMFHSFWNKGKDDATLRFLIEDNPKLTMARLALLKGLTTVIASGLAVIGVKPLEEMR
ncbi:MAG: arginine--tRNA ligase [Alphaproteobacteria bacterium]|nr:arginine--tRNA ligase [Alphaproteobacteria bacterium]